MRANHPIRMKLIEALLYDPKAVRQIINSSNPDYMLRLLHGIIPYRVGIEIDATGYSSDITKHIKDTFTRNKGRKLVLDFNHDGNSNPTECNETRFSFWDYSGLLKFKSSLDYFKEKKIAVASNGGLHVHIDLGMDTKQAKNKLVVERLTPVFKYIRTMIFKCDTPYGSYGKESAEYDDRAKISVSRGHNTIEYRIGYPTFDYTTIMRWVLCCQQINKDIRNNNDINLKITNTILSI